MKAKTKTNIKKGISLAILTILAGLAFIPLYWMVATAFTQPTLTMKFPPDVIPKNPTLDNFKELFQRKIIFRWTLNSAIVAGSVTLAQIFVCALAGYALAKKKFPGSKALFSMYIASMMIPTQVTLVPLYILISKMKLINTYPALILPAIAAPFGVFLMRQFMLSVPTEMIEAARIDGASELKTFFSIIIPISKPAMAVLGIFTFVGQWNSFLWPLIVTNTAEMRTLQAGLSLLQEQVPMQYSYLMASATYSAIPMMIVFIAFQKYFLRGITVGSVK